MKRIRAEMDSAIRASGYTGDFKSFVAMLRTDERFFMKDSASLVRAYRDIAKRIDPELSRLFGRLPRLTYGVATIPVVRRAVADHGVLHAGFSRRASAGHVLREHVQARLAADLGDGGAHRCTRRFRAIISRLRSRQEMSDLPKFRRYSGYTAFTEGWGLYAESLGAELDSTAIPTPSSAS